MPPRLGSLEEVLAALGGSRALLLASQIGNRNGFSKAMLAGRTAPELAPRAAAAAEIYGLRAELGALCLPPLIRRLRRAARGGAEPFG